MATCDFCLKERKRGVRKGDDGVFICEECIKKSSQLVKWASKMNRVINIEDYKLFWEG